MCLFYGIHRRSGSGYGLSDQHGRRRQQQQGDEDEAQISFRCSAHGYSFAGGLTGLAGYTLIGDASAAIAKGKRRLFFENKTKLLLQ
jgi:hypothetical protein